MAIAHLLMGHWSYYLKSKELMNMNDDLAKQEWNISIGWGANAESNSEDQSIKYEFETEKELIAFMTGVSHGIESFDDGTTDDLGEYEDCTDEEKNAVVSTSGEGTAYGYGNSEADGWSDFLVYSSTSSDYNTDISDIAILPETKVLAPHI